MSNTPQRGDPLLAIANRRLCARRPVASLAYVDMGENNGGIILNISEGGLAVTLAAPLCADGVVQMRLQLLGSSDWLEVGGESAWISESKREAGIRFVDLSEDARNQITRWIVSESPVIETQPEGVETRENASLRLEMPAIRRPQRILPESSNPDQVTEVHAQEPMTNPSAVPTLFAAGTSVEALTPVIVNPRLPEAIEQTSDVEAGDARMEVLARRRSKGTLAVAVIMLAFILSFLVGRFTAGPGARSGMLGRSGTTKLETGQTANGAEPSPTSSGAGVPGPTMQNAPQHGDEPVPLSSSTASDYPSRPVSTTPTEARSSEPAPASRDTNIVSSSQQIARAQQHALEPPHSVSTTPNVFSPQARNAIPSGPRGVAVQPEETSVTTPPSANMSQPEGVRTAGTAEQESAVSLKPAETPEVVKPSVSVSFSPYPSIRIPGALKSQMSRQGATLQIGQLISRVDPVYPEDAETQRAEGTVKLHAIIGQDGTIQSVEPRGGPASLVPAAMSAVRQWRYSPSSVGGQPVEAEQDVTITFQLLKQAARAN